MKISTKGRYALEALLCMGHLKGNEPISIVKIVEETNLSKIYLEQIFYRLRKKGILGSKRGPQGGYFIAIPIEKLTVNEIITAVEGEIIPVPCAKNEDECTCQINDICSTKPIWQQLYCTINDNLVKRTLAQLVCDFRLKEGVQ